MPERLVEVKKEWRGATVFVVARSQSSSRTKLPFFSQKKGTGR